MSQQEAKQQTIFGEELTNQIEIETTGRAIRPWVRMLRQVASEYRLDFHEEGVQVACTGSTNVLGMWTQFYADACETWDVNETIIGVTDHAISSALNHARYGKSTDDTIQIRSDTDTLETEVERNVGDCDATFTERSKTTDPDAIRQEPGHPDNMDFTLDAAAEISPKAYTEVTKALDLDNDSTVKIRGADGTMQVEHETDVDGTRVELDVDPGAETEWTMMSSKYVKKIATALENGYVNSTTFRWDSEMPLVVEFERDGYYSGTIMLAPRIQA